MPILRDLITTIVWMIVMMLIFMMLGCGPSGRDLSDSQWLELHQEMQAEREEVGRQRDQLESDRREFDARERNDPILAATISSSVLLLCCFLPLLVVAVLLWPRGSEPSQEEVQDVWIDEVVVPLVEKNSTTGRLAPPTQAASPANADPTDPHRLAHRE